MSKRDEVKSVYELYSFGFFNGREYEALDTLEAMRTVGEFEDRQRATVASFEAIIAARISAAVAAERELTERLMIAAWNLGALHASQSDEAYPAKIQRPIDIARALEMYRGSQKGEPS
jgi:hypothetical protein